MDDLVVWLRAQLDADAARAAAAPPGPWSVDVSGSIVDANGTRVIPSVGGARDGRPMLWPEGPVVEHVVGHDPARVLREIDAKRRIIAAWEAAEADASGEQRYADSYDTGASGWPMGREDALSDVLRLLALPYADRPGYRDKWRP